MWPLLGRTTLEVLRLLDWAREEVGASEGVVAGGVSMDGNIVVALAVPAGNVRQQSHRQLR